MSACIILGSGPSLKDAPHSFLNSLPTFGCNHIGLFHVPLYYICVDKRAILDPRIYDTAKWAHIAFLRAYFPDDPRPPVYDLPNVRLVTRHDYVFSGEHTHTGGTAVYLMLKIAYYMGFETVFLVGVDHTLDHFTDDYPPGVRSSMENRERHYRLAAKTYKGAGRKIINLSAPSVLDEIF